MKTPPQFSTPEFLALKAEWDQHLIHDGFDDIEQPPPCRPGGNPARHAAYHRDYLRPDNDDHDHHIPLDDLLAAEDGEQPPLLTRDDESLWTSRLDAIAEALHHFPFRNEKDRDIANAVYDGETWDGITKRLHVSHSRISRVQRQIRDWYRGR